MHPRQARHAAHMARVRRFGDEGVPAGFELTPQLGSAMWAHPFKTLAFAAAAVGVGMAVKEPAMKGASIAIGKIRDRF